MKKYLFILFGLLFLNSWNAQAQIDDTDLEELVIDKLSRSSMIDIIKKVRNQMYNNYADNNYNYLVTHQAMINDTAQLLNSETVFDVNINLKSKKINKSIVKDPRNKISMDTLFFNRYSGNDSPMYWLTEVVIRKYVNVPELDFFNNFKDYTFERKRTNDGQYVIEFYSEQFYEGYFQYDKNFNLKKMEFVLLKPYVIDHSQSEKRKVYVRKKLDIQTRKGFDHFQYK